jgi:hypothetical protein
MQFTTKTASGIDVRIETNGHDYCGMAVAELRLFLTHPQEGDVEMISNRYASKDGKSGALGHAFLGPKRKYLPSLLLTIPREDFDRALAAAEIQAKEAVARKKREDKARDDATKATCPAGSVPCRQKWSNGDLMSACYVAEDGTEVLASDLLENHRGWYWIPADRIAEARAKADAERAAKDERREAARRKRAAIFDQAKATGLPVLLDRYTEDCDGSAVDCSTDVVCEYAQPDGSVTSTRSHTH